MKLSGVGSTFDLQLRAIKDRADHGEDWITTEASIQLGEKKAKSCGAWLTKVECESFVDFLRSVSANGKSACLEFIEPNYSFEYNEPTSELKVRLSLESKPPWLSSGELRFKVTPDFLNTLANEFEANLAAIYKE